MKKLALFFALITFLFSCTKEKQEGEVLIRIKNETNYRALDVKIYSGNDANSDPNIEKSYGTVSSGQTTPYQRHRYIINYGPFYYFSLEDQGEFKSSQDILLRCDVGVKQLEPGNYTFLISMNEIGELYLSIKPD